MTRTIQEAITGDNLADIGGALESEVDRYRKTTGSYFNISTAGTVAALGTLGYLMRDDLPTVATKFATSVALEASTWGIGRLCYECYQQCKNYHNANIGKNFADSMKALREAEVKDFGKFSKALDLLRKLEEEIVTEGNKLFPNIEIMEQKLLTSKILREAIFRNRTNRKDILEKSGKLIENFNAWRDIQKGREIPGIAQMVTGLMVAALSIGSAAEIATPWLSQETIKNLAKLLEPPVGAVIATALPSIGPKTSYQEGFKAAAPMPDPKPTTAVPMQNRERSSTGKTARPTDVKTIAEVVPPYFEQYAITDKQEQVALVMKMEEEFPKRHPGRRTIPIKPEGIELMTSVIEEFLKEKGRTHVVTKEIKVELAKEVPDAIEEVEVPEVDLDSKSLSRSASEESLGESAASAVPQRKRRERLEVARDELVELVDAVRREKAEEARRKARVEAMIEVRLNPTVTVTANQKPDPHQDLKDFVAQARQRQLSTRGTPGTWTPSK